MAKRKGAQVKPASDQTQSVQASGLSKLTRYCGILVVLVYFIRGTVVPWHVPVPYSGWILLTVLSLSLAAGLAILGGGTWRWSWVLVLLVFAAGLGQAQLFNSALLRWFGLALLLIAVGPVVQNPVAIALRTACWRLTVKGLLALTAIFVVWYVLRLPNLGGRVYFTSFMNQSMLLGPIAGMGVVIATAHAIRRRSWRWGLLALLGMLPLLASGSRLATLATGAAGCFFIFRYKPLLGGLCGFVFLLGIYGFMSQDQSDPSDSSSSLTGALASKGLGNSRADLWQSRIEEFKSSPLVGIGVGMGTGSGVGVEASGDIRVEPGSSYLAVLAMTGGLGFVVFFSALGLLVFGYITSPRGGGLPEDILNVVGIYLAVHGVAEGWILGFGSPLCFLFWLWLGNFGDVATEPVRARIKSRLRPPQRFRTPQPAVRPF